MSYQNEHEEEFSLVQNVTVTWVDEKASNLPSGYKYITVAKFESDNDTWEKEAWSIILEFKEPPIIQGNPSQGTARFLVENAPIGKLHSGSTFEMFERRNKTAEIKVI